MPCTAVADVPTRQVPLGTFRIREAAAHCGAMSWCGGNQSPQIIKSHSSAIKFLITASQFANSSEKSSIAVLLPRAAQLSYSRGSKI
jgi:hypothetical protein